MAHEPVLLWIFMAFASAVGLGALFRRLGQPAVLGEILAGALLGPALLGWVHPGQALAALGSLGALALLFAVGLETPPAAILQVGGTALAVAATGVALPFAMGFWAGHLWGLKTAEALFLGAALTATSVGVTARVLTQAGALERLESRIILGAAVVDDVLGLLILSVVLALSGGQGLTLGAGLTLLEALGFLAFVVLLGPKLLRRYRGPGAHPDGRGIGWTTAVLLCLLFAVMSERLGLAAIVGAFLCGMVLAAEGAGPGLLTRASALRDFLTPFFLFGAGLFLDPTLIRSPEFLARAGILAGLAMAGKVAGCGLAALRHGPRRALTVGVGMVPHGEVGLIVASVGLAQGVLGHETYGLVVLMTFLTTFLGPLLLGPLLKSPPARP